MLEATKYHQIAKVACSVDGCPTVFTSDEDKDQIVVQGYTVSDLTVPAGESAVTIPISLVEDAMRQLAANRAG